MLILALDTTSRIASAALCRDGSVIAECEKDSQMNHSRTILPLIAEMLEEQKVKMNEIDVFAATVGPGSFTGVRIGVAAIKGYAWVLKKPCAAVSSLEAAAYAAKNHEGVLCAVIKARADEFFYAVYQSHNGKLQNLAPDDVATASVILEKLDLLGADICLCGDGAGEFFGYCADRKNGRIFCPEQEYRQNAGAAAQCAAVLADENKLVSANELMPSYLRLSQAEQMKQKGLIKS